MEYSLPELLAKYAGTYQNIISQLEEQIYPPVREIIHKYSDKGTLPDTTEIWKKIKEELNNARYWGEEIRKALVDEITQFLQKEYNSIDMQYLEGWWIIGEYSDGKAKVYREYKKVTGKEREKDMNGKVIVEDAYVFTVKEEDSEGNTKTYRIMITSRVKEEKSALDKLKLSTFTDKELSDLIGLRIIVFYDNYKEAVDKAREIAKKVLEKYIVNTREEGTRMVPKTIKGIPIYLTNKNLPGILYSQKLRMEGSEMFLYYLSRENGDKSDPAISYITDRMYLGEKGSSKKVFNKKRLKIGNKEIIAYFLDEQYLSTIENNHNTKSLWFIPINFEHALDKNKKYYIIIRTTKEDKKTKERITQLIEYLMTKKMVKNYGQMSKGRQLFHPILIPVDKPFDDQIKFIVRPNSNPYDEIEDFMSGALGIKNYGLEEPGVFLKDRYTGEIYVEGTGKEYRAVHFSLSVVYEGEKYPGIEFQLTTAEDHINNTEGPAKHDAYKYKNGNLITAILEDIMEQLKVDKGRRGHVKKEITKILDL